MTALRASAFDFGYAPAHEMEKFHARERPWKSPTPPAAPGILLPVPEVSVGLAQDSIPAADPASWPGPSSGPAVRSEGPTGPGPSPPADPVAGTVHVWALVDLDGGVREVRVHRSVPLLDAAAVAAVARWRFTPALTNGRPVRVWVAVPVRFSLH